MFSDTLFYKSIINTFIYLIVQVPVMIVLAMFIAVLLNGKKLVGKSFFRTAIFLPCVHLARFLFADYEEHLCRQRHHEQISLAGSA